MKVNESSDYRQECITKKFTQYTQTITHTKHSDWALVTDRNVCQGRLDTQRKPEVLSHKGVIV